MPPDITLAAGPQEGAGSSRPTDRLLLSPFARCAGDPVELVDDLGQLDRHPSRQQLGKAAGELAVVPELPVAARLEPGPDLIANQEVVPGGLRGR